MGMGINCLFISEVSVWIHVSANMGWLKLTGKAFFFFFFWGGGGGVGGVGVWGVGGGGGGVHVVLSVCYTKLS